MPSSTVVSMGVAGTLRVRERDGECEGMDGQGIGMGMGMEKGGEIGESETGGRNGVGEDMEGGGGWGFGDFGFWRERACTAGDSENFPKTFFRFPCL